MIKDIRKKYPQYGKLSDKELLDKVYEKYYSKIEKKVFLEKVGENTPLKTISKSINSMTKELKKSVVASEENTKKLVEVATQEPAWIQRTLDTMNQNTVAIMQTILEKPEETKPTSWKCIINRDSQGTISEVDINTI